VMKGNQYFQEKLWGNFMAFTQTYLGILS
jgi:hypothetical protein